MLPALNDISVSTPDPEFRRMLGESGLRTVARCAEKLGQHEIKEVRSRQAILESRSTVSQ